MNTLQSIPAAIKKHWLPIVILGASLLVQVALLSRSFNFLLTNIIPDDAFYYFQIARNIVAGHGSSFDGINLTNGYHPLWLVILLLIYKLFSVGGTNDIQPILIALRLGIVFNLVTGLLLLALVSRYTKNIWIQSIAIFVWCFNPYIIFQTISGLETSLSLMFIALFFVLAFKAKEKKTLGIYIWTAVIGGLMVLARIDAVFFLAMYYVWLVSRNLAKENLKKVLALGVVSLIVVSPWFIWNFLTFRMFLTSASGANTLVNHVLIVQDHGPSIAQTLKAVVYNVNYHTGMILDETGLATLFLFLLGAGAMFIFIKSSGNFDWKNKLNKIEVFLFGGFLLNFIANSAIRWTARPWYYLSFNIFLVLFIAWLLNKSLTIPVSVQSKRTTGVILIAIVAFLFYVSWSKDIKDQYSQQQEMFAAAQWTNTHIPPHAAIGSFNAGIQGYFSNHTLYDLDGLVNNKAFAAMSERKLWSYIKSQKIDYLSDFDIYLSYRYKSFFDTKDIFQNLTLVKNINTGTNQKSQDGINIYHIK